MRTAAVLPIKSLPLAKRRLDGTLDAAARRRLALAMATDVLAALSACSDVALVVMVSSEPEAGRLAGESGALLVDDGGGEPGQSAAVAAGIRAAVGEGAERVVCVPGDCPTLDPAELTELLVPDGSDVVIVPDRHGTGTNGLVLAPPSAIAPAFGPGSRERHSALARAAGLRWRLATPPSLTLDVDTGADLAQLRTRLASVGRLAANTRRVLSEQSP